MKAAIYEICIFGDTSACTAELEAALTRHFAEFNLAIGREVALDGNGALTKPNPKAASVGLFFGGTPAPPYVRPVALSDSDPIIPIVSDLSQCSIELPTEATAFNAMAVAGSSAAEKIAAATAECLGLLPARRRIFLSYRREEATKVALQLFDELSSRQFDVFLDTHEIRPGTIFQDVLWHSLSDCDVMLMLDTKGYFESRWTTEEFGKANLKQTSILRLGWPDALRDDNLSITDSIDLAASDFTGEDRLNASVVDMLAETIERLRSKSVSVRQAKLVGSLRGAVQHFNGTLSDPGQMRRVVARFPNGRKLIVYPIVGVPTSEHVNRIVSDAAPEESALLYDNLGILESWQTHLDWLGVRVEDFHWIKSGDAHVALKEALA